MSPEALILGKDIKKMDSYELQHYFMMVIKLWAKKDIPKLMDKLIERDELLTEEIRRMIARIVMSGSILEEIIGELSARDDEPSELVN
tara:strand:+ start:2637 stop:2900 length:264 start_codon:yes stop_codon:yes gene_type:complete